MVVRGPRQRKPLEASPPQDPCSKQCGKVKIRGTIQVATRKEDGVDEGVNLVMFTVVLRSLEPYRGKVRAYAFGDFDGLGNFMKTVRERLLRRHDGPTVKLLLHEHFRIIVQEIVQNCHFLQVYSGQQASPAPTVACYATPNLRLRQGSYATFLHADAVYESGSSTRAMIHVWIPLSKIVNYPLCFLDCPRDETVFAENKLYFSVNGDGTKQDEPLVMGHNLTMDWPEKKRPANEFYCMGHDDGIDSADQGAKRGKQTPPRMSLELRYMV